MIGRTAFLLANRILAKQPAHRYNNEMALIPAVGRKSLRSRLIFTVLYLSLGFGAVSTVYPFLLMLSQSITSDYDQSHYDIIPRYLTRQDILFGKYAEEKIGGNIDQINAAYGTRFIKLQDVLPPSTTNPQAVAGWNSFAAALPSKYKTAGFAGNTASYSPSRLLDRYHAWLTDRFHGDIGALNRAYIEEDDSVLTVAPPFEQPGKHSWAPDNTVKTRDWVVFQKTLPQYFFIINRADPLYDTWLKEESGYSDVNALNTSWGTSYKDFRDIPLLAQPSGNTAQRHDWETFTRTKLPFRYAAVAPNALGDYQKFITNKYNNNVQKYNQAYGTNLKSLADVTLPSIDQIPSTGPPLLDWLEFLTVVPLKWFSADTVETRYHTQMPNSTNPSASKAATLPLLQGDWEYVQADPVPLRVYYATRNYTLVFGYMALHGRALINTALYCVLAVATALIVNPLCAYALSRFNLSYGNVVLLYLLATMAFPAEVTMIPNFLLLKQLGLLNTFAALVLPGVASGYSIFLLKGFFDSLPRELYEAGTIDGASEARMFWTITLPVAKPIFAVIGLQAFTTAYAAYLFALVVCQDQKMWTMMVWLYELKADGAPDYVMLAGMVLSSIPLLIIFLFAQRTIMRGIILPSFK